MLARRRGSSWLASRVFGSDETKVNRGFSRFVFATCSLFPECMGRTPLFAGFGRQDAVAGVHLIRCLMLMLVFARRRGSSWLAGRVFGSDEIEIKARCEITVPRGREKTTYFGKQQQETVLFCTRGRRQPATGRIKPGNFAVHPLHIRG